MADSNKLREYLKRVTVDLHDARVRLRDIEEQSREPVAIVGMSCRLPGGVGSPDELWDLVAEGRDGVGAFPVDRGWDLEGLYDPDPDRPGTSYTREGGFVYDGAEFDAAFFGISPREAVVMDPQQRLFLEAAWEAVENAGIAPVSLQGSKTGVFVGVSSQDYGMQSRSVPAHLEGYVATAGLTSVVSGRVAYTLGLEGPAVTVDTACSSSLVGLHLACGALRARECSLALAGGVTVMASPMGFVVFSRQRGLARDGRCKSFANCADGAGWGEGVGVVVLERLSDARRLGHRILGLVRGSAVNQDGASNGLAAPNGPSQQRVIGEALVNARLSASDVDAVEGHGTGTVLGDPIEAQALLATYGRDRPEGRPLWLGSIKSNIGHTQAAAGVAGVIKMVMAMRRGVLPPTLHVDAPTEHVDWSTGSVSLLTESVPWSPNGSPRRAGVSAFGISGTNAHVILEEAPDTQDSNTQEGDALGADAQGADKESADKRDADAQGSDTQDQPVGGATDSNRAVLGAGIEAWVISAKTEPALRDQAERLLGFVERHPQLAVNDVGCSLAERSPFERRAVMLGADRGSMSEGLGVLARAGASPSVLEGVAGPNVEEGVVFVFPGQGSQWQGMARELLDSSSLFAAELERCGRALEPFVDWSVEDVLRGAADAPGLDRVDVVQPLLFAVMVALAGLWRACGVQPGAVVGHSQGEIAAAHVAGGLSLEDAARLVALRSRALVGLMGRGGMLSAALSVTEAQEHLRRWGDEVSVAAVNGPGSVVLSGERKALDGLLEEMLASGVRAREIPVGYASHSAQIEEIREELLAAYGELRPVSGSIPFFSTVTGGLLDTVALDGEYWYRNLREPVRFEQATRSLLSSGCRAFLEISPHPVLTIGIQETVEDIELERIADNGSMSAAGSAGSVLIAGTLRRDEGGPRRFLEALAQAWVHGVEVDWPSVFSETAVERVTLPTYPFQRQHYWLLTSPETGDVAAAGLASADHPLLGAAVGLADERGWLFTGRLSLDTHPWLADHAVMGCVLLPGTAFVELALRAGREVGCELMQELVLEVPLLLPATGWVQLQVSLSEPDEDARRRVEIYSRVEGTPEERLDGHEQAWTRHARGVLDPAAPQQSRGSAMQGGFSGDEAWPPQDGVPLDVEDLYDRLGACGLDYGPMFRGLRRAWLCGDEVFGEVELPEEGLALADRFGVHPALLDAALHATAVGLLDEQTEVQIGLPFSWTGVRLHAVGASSLRIRLLPTESGGVSLVAVDASGELVASVDSLVARQISSEQLAGVQGEHESLFCVDWSAAAPAPPAHAAPEVRWMSSEQSFDEVLDGDLPAPEVVCVDLGDLLQAEDPTGSGLPETAHRALHRALALLQTWLSDERHAASRLALLTSGAVAARDRDALPGLALAGVWGLVRSAQSEHPGRLVLLDVDGEEDSLQAIEAALALDEPQLAIREGTALVPRLTRLASARGEGRDERGEDHDEARDEGRSSEEESFGERVSELDAMRDRQGTVLITGGTGRLGGALAKHLVVEHGARHLLLASRQGREAPGAQQLESELAELGAEVTTAACDVGDREQLRSLLELVDETHPLSGVVHTAGALDDGVIDSLTDERLDRVLDAKADGAWHLHELTAHLDLSMFAMYSSAAGVLGGPGQGNYAAANTFVDALAAYRRARGLPGTSLAWGWWSDPSALTGRLGDIDRTRLARMGIAPLSTQEGLSLFDAAQRAGQPLTLPVRLDIQALQALARSGIEPPALLRGLVRMPARRAGEGGSLARRLQGAPTEEHERLVLEAVRAQVATVLGHPSPEAIDPRLAFKDLGFDSLTAVELRNRLNAITGLQLPATLVFDYPTPTVVAAHLLQELRGIRASTRSGAPVRRARGVDEPMAIVGIGCRYPGGVRSAGELWELVASGQDAIGGFPTDRGWDLEGLYDPDPDRTGKSYVRDGGFLYDAGDFDAGFFGISPREALAMDPQQRLLLEVSWEALEDAGIDPASLRGSQTGVFAGTMHHDYSMLLYRSAVSNLEGYISTGNSGSVVSGRVSYAFGLEGPAVTVDTACSSSLVALHLACQALRAGECSLAMASGVTVMASPGLFVELSRLRGLARDGRCKSFADTADGAGFSEGAGVVLLERLSDAQSAGRRVLGLVRGSAVNQDGASNGLAAPNGPSQQRVIAQALANAGLSVADVNAVEAHGTGTALGDPIEAQALLATYGQGRPDGQPLWLGSIKSNIGHTQAAAGVAGVIKVVMAMRRSVLPPTLHVNEPSKHVDWSAGSVSLLTQSTPWPRNGHPRRAGVSSFGVSGTNAHVILEEAPSGIEPEVAEEHMTGAHDAPDEPVVPWVLSGQDERALRDQARRLQEHADLHPELRAGHVGLSLAGRAMFSHRAVAIGNDRDCLSQELGALAEAGAAPDVLTGIASAARRVVFIYPGQGSQWVGMARGLLDRSPVFAESMDACAAAMKPLVEWSLHDVLRGEADAPGIERLDVVQPVLFAVMIALTELWGAYGVRPDVVLGHSQGEIVAAHVAGGLSLEDAARIVVLRSQMLCRLIGKGKLVTAALGAQEVAERLQPWGERVAIAAVNSPSSVVLSGDQEALDELLEQLHGEDVRARQLSTSVASHSPQVEAFRGELLQALEGISPRSGHVLFMSTVTGELLDTAELNGEYWCRNMREPVLFEQAVRSLLDGGYRTFVEASPHPLLTVGVQETLDAVSAEQSRDGMDEVLVVGSLRREEDEPKRFLKSLAQAWVRGVDVDWAEAFRGSDARPVELPTYAFQRERYWPPVWIGVEDRASAGLIGADHPLLGAVVGLADGQGWLFTGRLSLETHPWLADHVMMGVALLPGAAFLEMAFRVCAEVEGCESVQELTMEAPLVLVENGAVQLQVAVAEPDDSGRRQIAIYSRAERAALDGLSAQEGWMRHASGVLAPNGSAANGAVSQEPADGAVSQEPANGAVSQEPAEGAVSQEPADVLSGEAWPPPGAEAVQIDELYDHLAGVGVDYGPAFQGLRAAWRRDGEVFAEVSLPEDQRSQVGSFGLHPILLDAALHAIGFVSFQEDASRGGLGLAFSFAGVHLHARAATSLRVRLSPAAGNKVSVALADEAGGPVASVQALALRAISPEQLSGGRGGPGEMLFAIDWSALPAASAAPSTPQWAVLGDAEAGLAQALKTAATRGMADELDALGDSPPLLDSLERLSESIDDGAPSPAVVLVDCTIGALEDGEATLPNSSRRALGRVLSLIGEWLSDERFSQSRMAFLTQRAVAARAGESVDGLASAPLWGLLRSAQSENPGRFVLLDVDDERSLSALGPALDSGEPQLALREGCPLVPRLARLPSGPGLAPLPSAPKVKVDDESPLSGAGTVLLTGGTGALASLLARHLVVEHGVQRLLLIGRRGPEAEGAAQLQAELTELGCAEVRIAACDVSKREQLQALLDSIPEDHPLSAVVHTAGTAENGLVDSLTPEMVDRVLAPKLDGALHLHELTEHLQLEAFVLYSSLAGIFGGPGQGNYAAANTFLDALAQERHARGLRATSIVWSLWEDVGIGRYLGAADMKRVVGSAALGAISAEDGLALFDRALASGEPMVLPLALDRGALRAEARMGTLPALLRGLAPAQLRRANERNDRGSLARAVTAAPENERERLVLDAMRAEVAAVLGHASSEAVDMQRAFLELGFDSLMAVELRNRLSTIAGLQLPATLVFDHPTPAALAGYLLAQPALSNAATDDRSAPATRPIELGAANAGGSLDTLCGLFQRANDLGQVEEFMGTLSAVAKFRPTFDVPLDPEQGPAPVRLSEGAAEGAPASACLICYPSTLANSGPHQYARFARSFHGAREVLAPPIPGYIAGEPLPGSFEVAIASLAQAAQRAAAGSPFVLMGHSTGGTFAYAVAAHLQSIGVSPAGVILIDTYQFQDMSLSTMQPILTGMLSGQNGEAMINDVRLTAMITYMGLLASWTPTQLTCPTLLVRASQPMLDPPPEQDWKPSWDVPLTVLDAPGNHLTVMEEHAPATAQIVQDWIASAVSS
jgi:acyl transferase domain-containing protein/NADP-dependent 3-hydroxy acid dehydrogenase YdfG/acyl carrier protein